MKIALLGAGGIIGRELARLLAAGGGRDLLLLADLDEDRVRGLAHDLGAASARVDVTDIEGTAKVLKGFDIAVNATWYYHNVRAMEACLRAGVDYLDLGGLYQVTRKQLRLSRRFQEAGRLALLGCGKAPGITNVLAARGAPEFDRIEAVHLRSGRRALEPSAGIRLPYSPQTLFDEFTLRPIILRSGRLREIEPLVDRERVRHPDPFGEIEYVTTLHSELATLPRFLKKGVQGMEFRVSLAGETIKMLERLIRLGFASSKRIGVGGASISPRDFAVALLGRLPPSRSREVWITEVEVVGVKEGVPLRLVQSVTGDETQNGTALAAAAGTRLIERGRIQGAGVFPPEAVVPAKDFLLALRSDGLEITESRMQTREPRT
jgi:saccharopine dehydrogenase-like NADP-dependent oxidoreductase